MKLRIRSARAGPGTQTLRIEVPAGCTLDSLRNAIASSLAAGGTRFTPPIAVSLNKKDSLQGPPSTPISEFGIRGGDLLYYIDDASDQVSSHLTSTGARVPTEEDGVARNVSRSLPGYSGSVISDNARIRRELCAAAAAKRMASLSDQRSENSVCSSTPINSDADTFSAQQSAGNISQSSTRTGNGNVNAQNTSQSSYKTGTDNFKANGISYDTYMATEKIQDDTNGTVVETMDYDEDPPSTAVSTSIPAILQRVLTAESRNVQRLPDLLLVSVHAVMLETGFKLLNAANGDYNLPSGWSSSNGVLDLFYALQDVGNISNNVANANLKAQKLGDNLVLYGMITSGTSKPVYRLPMTSATHFRGPFIRRTSLSSDDHISLFSDIFALWKCVKDGLSLPLLTAICERAGLPVPSSLLILPMELKMKILENLSAHDLAKVACTCSELRHISANDELWKRLFLEEFGSSSVGQQPPCWKNSYKQRVLERRRALQRRVYPRRARYGISSRFAPRFPPMGGIIGGDYDIYPSFGSGVLGGGLSGSFGGGLPGSRVSLGALHGRSRSDGMDMDEMPGCFD